MPFPGGTTKHLPRVASRVAVVATLAAVGVLAAAQAALASWQQQNAPLPGTISDLTAVSCPASNTNFCEAVGSYSDNSGTHLLAEDRGGFTWFQQSISGPTGSELNDVFCTSNAMCIAVGDQPSGSNTVTFAEIWNGTGWTVQTVPSPSGATKAVLDGIGCTSTSRCIAVGSSSDGTTTVTLAAIWDGMSWSLQTTPNPVGATNSALDNVSCNTSTFCAAVGDSSPGTGTQTLAEAWNGTTWTIQTTPNPAGNFNQLNDVSCTLPTACTAVGRGFAERWNGGSWSLQTIAGTGGNTPADLTGVSCTSATTCSAVGTFFDSEAVEQLVAEAWNGTTWRVQKPPITTSFDSSGLSDIKCRSATQCTAVGFYHDPTTGDKALVEVYAPRWQPETVPAPSGALTTSLAQVSCASGSFCEAVGLAEDSGSTFPAFAEQWNGVSWTVQSTPNAADTNLNGVSCTSTTTCMAVGAQVGAGNTPVTLAEAWNGTSWTALSTPNPAGAARSFLTSVSCRSSTSCMAVGFWVDGSGTQQALAESWDGTNWTIQSTPDPSTGNTVELQGVSCGSATACTAVGTYLTPSNTLLAESWNGTNWTIVSMTNPNGTTDGFINGVSCRSATSCVAAGDYNNGSQVVPMAEDWNGTNWTAANAAVPSGATGSGITAISCAAATSCTATGFLTNNSGTFALAERWDGTNWAVQSVPSPVNGVTRSDLSGVSCTLPTHCMGVGFYEDVSGNDFALSELYA